MKKTRFLLLLCTVLFSTLVSIAQKGTGSDTFFFIQVTDPQFGFIDPSTGFKKETDLFEKTVININRLKPAFVVITGDFTHIQGDKLQIEEFKRITAMIDPSIPVYLTPGNHDIGAAPTQPEVDSYISDYGNTRFSFNYSGNTFIGFNSSIIKSNTPVMEQEQFGWLKNELAVNKDAANIILFCHHPFFIISADEADSNSNVLTVTRNKYLALFKEYGVKVIFAGHTHNNGYSTYGDMAMVITSSLGRPLGKDASGFRIAKITGGSLESTFYPLEEVPETITIVSD